MFLTLYVNSLLRIKHIAVELTTKTLSLMCRLVGAAAALGRGSPLAP